jgi:hypothetical protein
MDASDHSEARRSRKYLRRRDGALMLAVEETPGVFTLGKLVIIPSPSAIDRFEDTFIRARKTLQDGIDAGVSDDALDWFDFRAGEALQDLREALKR